MEIDQQLLPPVDKARLKDIGHVLACIPQSIYVMTAEHEQRQRGVMVSWVQQAGFDPPMVLVALRKGNDIVPLIHDSRCFALSQIVEDDRLAWKKFSHRPADDDNPLDAFEIERRVTGAPILKRAAAFMDCTLIRHLDIDGDHDLYVGLIRDGQVYDAESITIRLRNDGFAY